LPLKQSLKGFAPATGLQSYAARTLALNAGARPPSFDEWVASDGRARFELNLPDFTPMEAKQLRLVSEWGGPIPGFDPEKQDRLTPEQLIWLGRLRRRIKSREPLGHEYAVMPEERLAALAKRQERLLERQKEGLLGPKGERRLEKTKQKMDRLIDRMWREEG